ncbi:uncharacterized protein B0T15DRAFT_390154 [Chaetomium strumarium]|uniref:FAD/NAD(P)-binding domain-containing protein n=1 Tax=Chaetomium strumarium TaxID=1170767 RepID=A0AAJ0M4N8_9PEZI|nr:hypothetical protein B0T15DRAFT_390154 [Chaetomium strumarium]
MAKTIVILGASYAGIPIAHYLLKHTTAKVKGLKVIIVAPNTHMYWNVAAVRGILPDMMPDEKLFLPLAPAFSKYPSDQYEFVRGVAENVDASRNVVEVRGNDGHTKTIQYDELVIATGSSFKADMPFKNLSSTEKTKDTLHDWSRRIKSAKSIVVAGAGATGIEIAGELGQEYAVTGKKQVILVSDQELPLTSKFTRAVRETAKKELERLKVKVITNAKAAASSTSPNTITLTKPDGTTTSITADLVIPTYGITPNTSFLPPAMLDSRGFVKQTARLRAEGHDNIFVVGDAGNLEDAQGLHTDAQVVHVVKFIDARLLGSAEAEAQVPDYKPADKVVLAASLGKNRGIGQVGKMRLWGWLIAWLKGKHLGTNHAAAFVRGERTLSAKEW